MLFAFTRSWSASRHEHGRLGKARDVVPPQRDVGGKGRHPSRELWTIGGAAASGPCLHYCNWLLAFILNLTRTGERVTRDVQAKQLQVFFFFETANQSRLASHNYAFCFLGCAPILTIFGLRSAEESIFALGEGWDVWAKN